MKIVTVVGARPQFIKAAPVGAALAAAGIDECLVDTGQHYDDNMAGAFFRELGLKRPAYSLGIGSGSHGQMTGRMLEAVERVLVAEAPDCVLVYGDTNTTLAGALAAAKLKIPIVHVEAGVRSYRPTMPEEINRRLVDHMSSVLFCPSVIAVENLRREGISDRNFCRVVEVGDVMVDALRRSISDTPAMRPIAGLDRRGYALVTLHRAETTDDDEILIGVVDVLLDLAATMPVLFPVHPRTAGALRRTGQWARLEGHPGMRLVEPLGYRAFLEAQSKARVVVTDSGGVQKEACILGAPCLTLRNETEWTETVDAGWNRLMGLRPRGLVAAAVAAQPPSTEPPALFGDGRAAERIAAILVQSQFRGSVSALMRDQGE